VAVGVCAIVGGYIGGRLNPGYVTVIGWGQLSAFRERPKEMEGFAFTCRGRGGCSGVSGRFGYRAELSSCSLC